MSSLYSFATLPEGHFRLVSIEPSNRSSPLICSLQTFALNEHPSYEALSYAWGSGEPSESTIDLGNGYLRITHELDQALRQLRRTERSRTFWIDALCINQNDLFERNAQVAIMTQIYHSAERVVAWLGPESEDSLRAFDFLKEMAVYKKGILRGTYINGARQGSDTSSECGNGGVGKREEWLGIADEKDSDGGSVEHGEKVEPLAPLSPIRDVDDSPRSPSPVISRPASNGEDNNTDVASHGDSGAIADTETPLQNLGEDPNADPQQSRVLTAEEEAINKQWEDYMQSIMHNQTQWGHIQTAIPQLYYDFSSVYDDFFQDTHQAKWEAFDNLLARPWWSRTWIVQEVWHSSNCIIQCGEHTLKWKTFQKAMDYQEGWDDMGYLVKQTKRWKDWPNLKKRYGLAIHLSKKRLLGAKLSDVLWNTWDREATDSRDKVFAILSLVNEQAQDLIPRADYSMSMQQVYTAVARHIIEHDKKLDILLAANGTGRQDGLPSWVPDWRRIANEQKPALFINGSKMTMLTYFSGSTDYIVLHGHGYSASGTSEAWAEFGSDSSELRVRSLELAKIAHVGPACGEGHDVGAIVDAAKSVMQGAGIVDFQEEELRIILRAGSFIEDDDRWATPGRREDQVIQNIMNKRRFFVTDKEHLCIGPAMAKVGDAIHIIAGCSFPMVLRRDEEGTYGLVGEAYVHNNMAGEALGDQSGDKPESKASPQVEICIR